MAKGKDCEWPRASGTDGKSKWRSISLYEIADDELRKDSSPLWEATRLSLAMGARPPHVPREDMFCLAICVCQVVCFLTGAVHPSMELVDILCTILRLCSRQELWVHIPSSCCPPLADRIA